MVIGIHKGNKFELMIYKDLRTISDKCKRTIGSGSSDEPGDIIFNHYVIECKHLKVVRWVMLTKFWKKLNAQCREEVKGFYGKSAVGLMKEPVIVFRQNREPVMAMFLTKVNGHDVRVVTSYNLWKQII